MHGKRNVRNERSGVVIYRRHLVSPVNSGNVYIARRNYTDTLDIESARYRIANHAASCVLAVKFLTCSFDYAKIFM